jgi:hypothetical protein
MGLGKLSIQYLLQLRRTQKWEKTITLGRLNTTLSPDWINKQLTQRNLPAAYSAQSEKINDALVADDFFRALGAKTVDSLDGSSFEKATIIHDLNEPIGKEHWEKYDLVFDGGTTEHVFNFPMAIGNAMRLLKVGGTLITHVPINCLCGHGFYQFSPELFFRVMSPHNGFKTEKVLIHGLWPNGGIYEAIDPEKLRQRVELMAMSPLMMVAHAVKTAPTPDKITAIQSDYFAVWEQHKAGNYKAPVKQPRIIQFLINGWRFYTAKTLRNRKHYKPFHFEN